MLRAALALVAGVVIAVVFVAAGHGPAKEPLDWSGPYRWVHIDNVDTTKAATFEDARTGWLRALRKKDGWLDDGNQDVVAPAVAALTELTAAVGRLEFLQPDVQKEGQLERLWKTVRETLEARNYPLACRTFRSVFGTGEIVRLWLAPDAATMVSAPSISSVLEKALGEAAAKALVAELDSIVTIRRTSSLERRPDLSNLPR